MMTDKPSSLPDRLRRLENASSKAAIDIMYLEANMSYASIMIEEMLIPAVVHLLGMGHREKLMGWLRSARDRQADAQGLDESLRLDREERIRDWIRAINELSAQVSPAKPTRRPDPGP